MFDKIVHSDIFNDVFVEIGQPYAAVLDVLPDGSRHLKKNEGFDEEESYAIIGDGHVAVGYYNLPKKGDTTFVRENEMVSNALYPLFPIRKSLLGKGRYTLSQNTEK